jgi:hypothetical protein
LALLTLGSCRGGGTGDFNPPPSNEIGSDFVWLMPGGDPAHTSLVGVRGPQSGVLKRETVRDVMGHGTQYTALGGGLFYTAQVAAIGAYDGNARQAWLAPLRGVIRGLAYAPDGKVYALDGYSDSSSGSEQDFIELVAISSSGQVQRLAQLPTSPQHYYSSLQVLPSPRQPGGFVLLALANENVDSLSQSSRISFVATAAEPSCGT